MKHSIRTQLITLANLSGLDNTERLLVSRLLPKRTLTPCDQDCIKAMAQRHLTGVRR